MDVCTTVIKDRGKGGNLPHRNKRQDVCMDPKDLPKHMQPLMEWIAEDLTVRKQEELSGDYLRVQRCI